MPGLHLDNISDDKSAEIMKENDMDSVPMGYLVEEKAHETVSVKDDGPHATPDDILTQIGGCGTFQYLLVIIVHAMKTVVCWGMMGTAFFAFTPRWRCVDEYGSPNMSLDNLRNMSRYEMTSTNESLHMTNTSEDFWNERCTTVSGEMCTVFAFEAGTKTLVTAFDLVCDNSWIPAFITSLQMVGMCCGSLLSGQLADFFGRRIPLFASMGILSVFHLVSYFAKSWIQIVVSRFFIGIGSAFFLATCYTILTEYTLSRWRAVVTGIPSWAVESCLFALFGWLLRDWQLLTLMMAIMAFVTMAAWFFVPESFRWYATQNRYDDAESVVKRISKWNRHSVPDLRRMRQMISSQKQHRSKKYSVIVLFRRLDLLKITVPLTIIWCTMGMISYGINFAIQKLSGDIYVNIFLFSIASTPSKFISIYLQNRFGRRTAATLAIAVCLLGGLTVGIVQYIDTPYRNSLTNYSALAASVGADAMWGPMQTLTLELYPTVVRNTGFGTVSIMARVGAVIGPQFVFLSQMVPGLLYFMVAAMSLLSILGTCTLPETRNTSMVDMLGEKRTRNETQNA